MILIHATTVAIEGRGVLIRGPSGAGKSDLALRLIEAGARLVADDQTEVRTEADGLVARSPAAIAGLIEVRGLGIVRLAAVPEAPLALVVDLVPAAEVERLPAPAHAEILGVALPRLALDPWPVSAAIKVRLAVLSPSRDIMPG